MMNDVTLKQKILNTPPGGTVCITRDEANGVIDALMLHQPRGFLKIVTDLFNGGPCRFLGRELIVKIQLPLEVLLPRMQYRRRPGN